MTTEQTVILGFGKMTLRTQTMSIAALRVRPPFVRDSAVTTSRRQGGTMVTTPVSRFPVIHGNMYSDRCAIPDGTILMFQSQWRRGSVSTKDGCVLLRLRPGAATLNIKARLPHGPESLLGDVYQVFMGNADILSPEEAQVMKIDVPARFIQTYFNLEEVEECFIIDELNPERERKPDIALVSTSQGLVVKEVPAPATRRMRIRPRG